MQLNKEKYDEYQIKTRTKYFSQTFVILIVLMYISAIISEIYFWAQPILVAVFITEITGIYLIAKLIFKKAYWKFSENKINLYILLYLTFGVLMTLAIIVNIIRFGSISYYFTNGYFTLNCIQIFISINFLEIAILSIIRFRLDKKKHDEKFIKK